MTNYKRRVNEERNKNVRQPGGKSRPKHKENTSFRVYPNRTVERTDSTNRAKQADGTVKTVTTTTWVTHYEKKKNRCPRPLLSACLLMPACR